jgi:hypothetical protein
MMKITVQDKQSGVEVMDALHELKALKEEYEAEHRFCMGVHLPADFAVKIRKELRLLYGHDPGAGLMTLYGLEVLSTDAPKIKFVG